MRDARGWGARMLLAVVAFYRRWLSPLKRRPSCRFLPSCSAYAEEALVRYGAWRGGWKALWRILRCQPLGRGGVDLP